MLTDVENGENEEPKGEGCDDNKENHKKCLRVDVHIGHSSRREVGEEDFMLNLSICQEKRESRRSEPHSGERKELF